MSTIKSDRAKLTEHTPIIICRLCDENGVVLNPYEQNSIKFTELTSPENRYRRRLRLISGRVVDIRIAKILIHGYVSVCIDEQNLSAPIRFSIIQKICINAPENTVLKFTVNNFVCQALPCDFDDYRKIMINIETRVCASAEDGGSSVSVNRTVDTVRMLSRTCLIHGNDRIGAAVYQYTAISDGVKRVYTNADALKQYGDMGIPSPQDVSYYNLYVNGVLQPKINYNMTKGRLEFITDDLPTQGAPIIIKYITFAMKNGVNLTDDQYYAIADGVNREYTDADALEPYSIHGIPAPCDVSYYNLYVNGVLQPKENYIVEKGLLKFITTDIPQKGRPIILESIAIKDACGRFLEVEDYQYDVISDESRVYCSGDDITPYGQGILSPCLSSYQNLLVNAVNQPDIDYKVADNCLIFKTADLPTAGSPVTFQSVRVLNNQHYVKPCDIWMCLCLATLLMHLRC